MEEMFGSMAATGVFTVEDIRQTFASADVDHNAVLSFEEFKQFFKVRTCCVGNPSDAFLSITITMLLAFRTCLVPRK